MVLTRREIALKAGRQSAENARRRRFERFAKEISENPDAISDVAAVQLAEALHERGGWRVFEDH
jgi:hypothetical protein